MPSYTITYVHQALGIPETNSTPYEYAAPTAKWVHRLIVTGINNLLLVPIVLLGDEETIMAKCLVQGHERHNWESYPLSGDSGTRT